MCADVGIETLLFFGVMTALVILFVVRARRIQAWIRARPRWADGLGLMFGLERVLEARNLRAFVLLVGPVLLVMWSVSVVGVYCYLHGTDLPLP